MSGWDDFVSGFDDGDAGFEFLKTKAALQTDLSMVRNITQHRLKPFWVLWKVSVNLQREFMKHNFCVNHSTLSRSEIWVGTFKWCYIRRLLIFCAKLGNVFCFFTSVTFPMFKTFTSNMIRFVAKWANVWLRWFC